MVNPQEGKTEMIAAKKVQIRMLRPTEIKLEAGERIVQENEIVEVPEELAKELCEAHRKGPYQYRGKRSDSEAAETRGNLARAVRV
jgi:hypothetical protein